MENYGLAGLFAEGVAFEKSGDSLGFGWQISGSQVQQVARFRIFAIRYPNFQQLEKRHPTRSTSRWFMPRDFVFVGS